MTADHGNRGIRSWARKGLGIAGLVLAAGLFQGCIVSSSSSVCNDGEIRTSWVLNGNANECLPGDIVSMQVDDASMIADFNCGAHQGTTPEPVQGGVTHVLTYTLSDAQGHVLATAGPFSIAVPCGTSVATPVVDFPVQ